MKRIKVGLNGFGRTGRSFARIALLRDSFDIVLINTRKTPPKMLAYLLQHDSIYRKFAKEVLADEDGIVVSGKKIYATQIPNLEEIPWDRYQVDVIVDATGAFENAQDLQKHIKGTVKKVVLTAPAKEDDMPHIVLGVNDDSFDFQKTVISNCSCTTNCAAILFKVLDDHFKVLSGFLTTIHAYTQTQTLLDDSNKSFGRARAAGLNIIPSTTGAAEAIVRTMPHLKGRVDGMALRVPVPVVSFSDVSAIVEKKTSKEEIDNTFKQEAENRLKGILKYEEEVLVSSDYIGSPYSCIYDSNYTKVMDGNLVKVFGWYDNEWGYSSRLVDLVERMTNYV